MNDVSLDSSGKTMTPPPSLVELGPECEQGAGEALGTSGGNSLSSEIQETLANRNRVIRRMLQPACERSVRLDRVNQ